MLLAPAQRRAILDGDGPIVFLTGAGISAESGIPTFRGPEGYWQVGSRNYHPAQMATAQSFAQMPDELWRWYLYRRSTCRAAAPNAAHAALVSAEAQLGDRFQLVTQNVDGLHLRAGQSPARTWQIHGNIDFCRCAAGCAPPVRPMPQEIDETWPKDRALDPATRAALQCRCGGWLRPHVLWFDESYDEPLFRYESARRAAHQAAALVVIGTSGATNLPITMCELAVARGIPFVVIDPDRTDFVTLAERSPAGVHLVGTACQIVPPLVQELTALR